jgi:hypothetical protein
MLLELVGIFGLGAVVAACVGLLLVRHYLPAYLGEKGKNLATREDIAEITHEVERVRLQYASLLEELKTRNSLRMAALERRLQAHQEAFTHWRDLMSKTHSEEAGSAVIVCQSWWEQNCLYLEPEVRQAFVDAYSAAAMHNQLVKSRPDYKVVQENWQRITNFPDLVFKAVQLPAMSSAEAKSLVLDEPSGAQRGG